MRWTLRTWIAALCIAGITTIALVAVKVERPLDVPDLLEEALHPVGIFQASRGIERSPSTSLETIVAAQRDFRENDRDGDGKHEYWRGDIAGLYALHHRTDRDKYPLKLIELFVAGADVSPVVDISLHAVPATRAGYWYAALRHEYEAMPQPDRFAACCFPSSYPSAGRMTYIIDETGQMYERDLRHGLGVRIFPRDPIEKGWRRVD